MSSRFQWKKGDVVVTNPQTREPWVCTYYASTYRENGRRVSMKRTLDACGDIAAGALRALRERRDGGAPFVGCEITCITPLGQKRSWVLQDRFGEKYLAK